MRHVHPGDSTLVMDQRSLNGLGGGRAEFKKRSSTLGERRGVDWAEGKKRGGEMGLALVACRVERRESY